MPTVPSLRDVSESDSRPPKATANPNPKRQLPPVRVLVIEDNPGDARLFAELLADSPTPFAVEHRSRLDAAIERLKCETEDMPDVVLTDLMLPDCQGLATFQRVRSCCAGQVPVIVLSGLADEALAVETVQAGAQDYLVKGEIDGASLARAIHYAIKRAESERELAEERNLLRSVINNLLDSVYVKDARGRYRLNNVAHQRFLGVERSEDIIGKTVFDFYPREAARRFHADDQHVMRSGEPIVNRHEPFVDAEGSERWLSTTKVALRNHVGKIIGLVGIGRDITERKRAEAQLASYNEQLREKKEELEDDLEMASEIQQAFLPHGFPTFPPGLAENRSALQFHSRYLPTGTVGGDFFHVLPLSDSQAGVFICDVMGHGVRAALVTAIQRALVEELADVAGDPGAFLTRMNHALLSILRRTRTPMFASAFYLYVDVRTGEMRFSNAGHPRPFQLRRSRGEVALLNDPARRAGPALGVFDETLYETQRGRLSAGDLVFLFTDGLYEVEGPHGEFLDQDHLFAAIRRRIKVPTEQMFDELLKEVRGFAAQRQFFDDVCLVGVELDHLFRPGVAGTNGKVALNLRETSGTFG